MSYIRTVGRHLLVFFAIVAIGSGNARGQVQQEVQLERIREAFRDLDYEQVEDLSADAIAEHEQWTPDQLAEVHVLLGLVQYYRGSEEAARASFVSALSLDGTLEIDPLLAPPQALAFFEEVKQEALEGQTSDAAPGQLRYVVLRDRRPAAALRSFVAPGWGQLYKREQTKGMAILGLWVATAGGGAAAHLVRADAERAYEDPGITDSDEIRERYDTFNRWHKVRNNLWLGAAVIWIYSAVDVVATGAPRIRSVERAESVVRVHLTALSTRPALSVGARF